MMMRPLLVLALAVGASFVAAHAAGAELRPPIPHRALEQVLPHALVAGRALTTVRFTVAGEAGSAADEIAAAWRAGGARDVVRRDSGRWQIVSRVAGAAVETVQLESVADGTSSGLLTRWDLRTQPVSVLHHPRRLLAEDATWVDQVISRDAGRVAVTTVALVTRSVAAVAGEIATRAREMGFVREPVIDAGAGGGVDIAIYRKAPTRGRAAGGRAELVVTVERHGERSAAVIHLVEEQAQ